MDSIIIALEAAGFDLEIFLKASAILLLASLFLAFIGRFLFGKRSSLSHAVSSAIGILFLYAATIVLYSMGTAYSDFVAPLPFVTFTGDQLLIFSFHSHYTVICSQILSMVILAFLMNLCDGWLPKGKSLLGWLFYRCLTIVLALFMHLLITGLFRTLLPDGIVTYAPTILLWLLVIMLAVGALKFLVGILLATVNPLVGALYTFFFASAVGRQLTRAMLTTCILGGLVYALEAIGCTAISIASAALVAYVPLLVVLLIAWYLVTRII